MDFNLTLIGQTIAMIVFVWFCMKFIWPPVMKAIEERRKEIADGIAAGEKGQKELAEARHGSEAILARRARRRRRSSTWRTSASNEMVGEAKDQAAAEGERIVAAARSELAN